MAAEAGSAALRHSYEDLRTQASKGGRGPGLALFLRDGMREWIEVCCSCAPVMTAIEPARATVNPEYMAAETRPEIISILAGLFLQKRWETTR